MAEIYSLDESGWRKLLAEFRQQKNEMANLRRHLQHVQGQRMVYMPRAASEFAFASFRSHTASPTYTYPLPDDANEDNIFPAFIQRSPTFIDDTTAGGFAEQQALTYAGGYDFDAEPVIVYSLRGTYIPPDDPGGWGTDDDRLLPIFKVNEKWYCDYIPRVRVYFDGSYTGGGAVSPGNTVTIDLASSKLYEGVPEEQYSPLQVDSAGIITAYRKMDVMVTLTADVRFTTSASSGNVHGACVFQKTSGSTASTSNWSPLNVFVAPTFSGSVWSFGSPTKVKFSTTGIVRFDPSETLQFEAVVGGSQCDLFASDIFVTLTPIETLSW
jgi:hypothetical protein